MSTTDLVQVPAASPPPGVNSDLLHPHTKDTLSGVAAAIVGMFIATIFLMIRIYTKVFLARRFGFDDVALLLSKALSVIVQVLIVYLKMQKIEGVHVWDLSVRDFKETPACHQRQSRRSVLSCMDRFTQRKYGIGRAGEITQTGSLIGRDRQSQAQEAERIQDVSIESIHSSTGAATRNSSAKEQNMTTMGEALDGDETEVIPQLLTASFERVQEESSFQADTGHSIPDEIGQNDS